MYACIGMLVIVTIIAMLAFLTRHNRVPARNTFALGVIALFGGLAIPNLTFITKIQMTASGLNAEIGRAQTEAGKLAQLTAESQRIQQQVASVVQEAKDTRQKTSDASTQALTALSEIR